MFEPQTPDRVDADLRQHEASASPAPSEEDMRDAKQELEEELLAGKRVGRVDLEALIDHELDRNYASALRSLFEHFAGIGALGTNEQRDRCQAADAWMLRLIRAHLDGDAGMIHERAERIAADRRDE